MAYLLDTNIISETVKNIPNENVLSWLSKIDNNELYISVLTLGEIKKGIERLPAGNKKNKINNWLENTFLVWFKNNLLPIDKEIAEKWGYITGTYNSNIPAIDGLIAATALTYNLKLVTRNEKDFNINGLEVINPFDFEI